MSIKKDIIIAVVGLIVIGALWTAWQAYEVSEGPVACTMEAKLCPDGSAVGRAGPNCEFAECPAPPLSGNSGIKGMVLLGPTCPVMRDPPDPLCADKPYATTLAVTSLDGAVIAEFTSGPDGQFSVLVPAGEYAIRSAAAANVLPYCASRENITVAQNAYTQSDIFCDSGIR